MKKHIIGFLLALAFIIPANLLAQTSFVTETQLASASLRLLQVAHDGRPVNSSKIQELVRLAQTRRNLMLQALRENPAMVGRYVWAKSVRDTFPPAVRSLIEEEKNLTGETEVIYAENFTTSLIQRRHFIDTSDYGVIELFSADNLDNSVIVGSPSVASVAVYLFGNSALLTAATKDTMISSKAKTAFPLLGQKKLAVVLFKFADQPDTELSPGDIKEIRQSTFTDQDSLTSYYQETSAGKFTVAGNVFGPYLASDVTAEDMKCTDNMLHNAKKLVKTFRKIGQGVINSIAKNNPSIKNYDYYLFATPEVCALTEGFAIEKTNMAFVDGPYNWVVAAHEFGHLLNLGHADGLFCSKKLEDGTYESLPVDGKIGSACRGNEYADPFSIMGRPGDEKKVRQLSNFHKGRLGWLDRSKTRTITASGVYNITASNIQPSATPIYRMPIATGGYQLDAEVVQPPFFYYLEYRTTAGHFDKSLSADQNTRGVSIRLAGDYDSVPGYAKTFLLDATPFTPLGLEDAFIGVGNSFRDDKRKITVEVLSADQYSARVKVTFNSESKLSRPDLLILEPSTDGQNLSGVAKLTAVFSSPANGYIKEAKLYIDNFLSWISPFRPTSPLTRNLSTWKLPTGPHKIKFTVTDNKFQTASAERSVDIVPDTTPPVVEITKPPNGATTLPIIANAVSVSARAKDQSGIGDFKICVNNNCTWICQTATGAGYVSCHIQVPISQLANQSVKVVALALDRAYDPNQGAAGLVFPAPLRVNTDTSGSGTVVFGPLAP